MMLDRSRPYATVHGNTNGIAFEQNGRVFDAAGNEMPLSAIPTDEIDSPDGALVGSSTVRAADPQPGVAMSKRLPERKLKQTVVGRVEKTAPEAPTGNEDQINKQLSD